MSGKFGSLKTNFTDGPEEVVDALFRPWFKHERYKVAKQDKGRVWTHEDFVDDPNYMEARGFLDSVYREENWNIRFRLLPEVRTTNNIVSRIGTLEEHWAEINWYSEHGWDIFYVVNNALRSDKWSFWNQAITSVNALYIDFDIGRWPTGQFKPLSWCRKFKDDKLLEMLDWDFFPSCVMETRNGLHCYWFLEQSDDIDMFCTTQRALISRYGSDRSIYNPAHMMRVPGTKWWKGGKDSFDCHVVYNNQKTHNLIDIWENNRTWFAELNDKMKNRYIYETPNYYLEDDKEYNAMIDGEHRRRSGKKTRLERKAIKSRRDMCDEDYSAFGDFFNDRPDQSVLSDRYSSFANVQAILDQDINKLHSLMLKQIYRPDYLRGANVNFSGEVTYNHPVKQFDTYGDMLNWMYVQSIADVIGRGWRGSFHCLFHDDRNPSASIFKTRNGNQIYKCHASGCNFHAGNIINVLKWILHTRDDRKAVELAKKIFRCECPDWLPAFQQETRQYTEANIRRLDDLKLTDLYPSTKKVLSLILDVPCAINGHCGKHVHRTVQRVRGNHAVVHYGMSQIAKDTNRSSVVNIVNTLALLGLIKKPRESELPHRMLMEAREYCRVNKKQNFPLHIEIFPYTDETLAQAEQVAEKMISCGVMASRVTRDNVVKHFGQEVADTIYVSEIRKRESIERWLQTPAGKNAIKQYNEKLAENDSAKQDRQDKKTRYEARKRANIEAYWAKREKQKQARQQNLQGKSIDQIIVTEKLTQTITRVISPTIEKHLGNQMHGEDDGTRVRTVRTTTKEKDVSQEIGAIKSRRFLPFRRPIGRWHSCIERDRTTQFLQVNRTLLPEGQNRVRSGQARIQETCQGLGSNGIRCTNTSGIPPPNIARVVPYDANERSFSWHNERCGSMAICVCGKWREVFLLGREGFNTKDEKYCIAL